MPRPWKPGESCADCKTDDNWSYKHMHYSHGLCQKCYWKARRKDLKKSKIPVDGPKANGYSDPLKGGADGSEKKRSGS